VVLHNNAKRYRAGGRRGEEIASSGEADYGKLRQKEKKEYRREAREGAQAGKPAQSP